MSPLQQARRQSSREDAFPSQRSLFPQRVLSWAQVQGLRASPTGSVTLPPGGLAHTHEGLPSWGGSLQADAHTQFPEEGRFLQLQALSTADSGDYSCTAHNAAGSTSLAFHVEVHSECSHPTCPAHPPESDGPPAPAPSVPLLQWCPPSSQDHLQ